MLSFTHAGIEGRYSSHPLFKTEVLTSHAQISISSLQITGEKLKCDQEPGEREIILHLIIRNATCFRILHSSIHQSMWYLCTSFIWLQPYNEIQSGNMASKHQHRPCEREFSSAMFLVPKCQPVWYLQSDNQKLQLISTNPVRKHYPYRRQCPYKRNISTLILLWRFLPSYSFRLIRIQTVLLISYIFILPVHLN